MTIQTKDKYNGIINVVKYIIINDNLSYKKDITKAFFIACNFNKRLVLNVLNYMYKNNLNTISNNGYLDYIQIDDNYLKTL